MNMQPTDHTPRRWRLSALWTLAAAVMAFGSPGHAAEMYHGPGGPSPISGLPEKPRVPFQLGLGMLKFQENCSSCHGQWAEGTADKGPPLVHSYYEPNHHGDEAFYRAVSAGSKQHHWQFGDMPPVQKVTREDMDRIIPFLRWWQQSNGIGASGK